MQIHKTLLLVAILFVVTSVFGRSGAIPNGAKPAGMGNAFVSQFDVFSVYHNQAGLANINRTSVSFFYENRFLVPEMSNRAGVITFPTNVGNFAVNYNAFGPSQWAESNVGFSYARYLTEKLSAAIHFNYFGTKLPEINKTAATGSFEIGAIYKLTDNTFLGAHIANPYAPPITTFAYEDEIPWRISVGGHTEFTKEFTFSYEVEAVESYFPSLLLGVEWEAAENFFFRGGFNTGPARFSAGFGYLSSFLKIDAAFSYHNYLGYTPSVSLIFSFF